MTQHRRHNWTWITNYKITSGRPGSKSWRMKGIYRCSCGATRYGAAKEEVHEPSE